MVWDFKDKESNSHGKENVWYTYVYLLKQCFPKQMIGEQMSLGRDNGT